MANDLTRQQQGTTATTPVAQDSPLWRAYQAYTATEDYANTKRWAVKPEHTEGSLWAAFEAGFSAGAELAQQLRVALSSVVLAARTSGGVAGRDDALCAACDAAEAVLRPRYELTPKGRDALEGGE